MTHWYMLALADGTVGLGWDKHFPCHMVNKTLSAKTFNTCTVSIPNSCYPSFMSSPATLVGTLYTPPITRLVIIIILRALHNHHVNLVKPVKFHKAPSRTTNLCIYLGI